MGEPQKLAALGVRGAGVVRLRWDWSEVTYLRRESWGDVTSVGCAPGGVAMESVIAPQGCDWG